MDYQFLSRTALFRGIQPEEIKTMLSCLTAERKSYEKGEMIYRAGDAAASLGVVLDGKVLIEHDDLWGNTTVLDSVLPGQIFAETYACTAGEPLMVNVEAAERSQILFLNKPSHECYQAIQRFLYPNETDLSMEWIAPGSGNMKEAMDYLPGLFKAFPHCRDCPIRPFRPVYPCLRLQFVRHPSYLPSGRTGQQGKKKGIPPSLTALLFGPLSSFLPSCHRRLDFDELHGVFDTGPSACNLPIRIPGSSACPRFRIPVPASYPEKAKRRGSYQKPHKNPLSPVLSPKIFKEAIHQRLESFVFYPMDMDSIVDKGMVMGKRPKPFIVQNIIKIGNARLEYGTHAHQAGLQGDKEDGILEIPSPCFHGLTDDAHLSMFQGIVLLFDSIAVHDKRTIRKDKNCGNRDFASFRDFLRFSIKSIEIG